MKKTLLLVVSALLMLVGCEPPITPVITLQPTELTLNIGQTDSLEVTITPEGTTAQIIWESSQAEVATVDANGVITAVAVGTTTITASGINMEPAQCVVTVRDNSIILSLDSIQMLPHDTYRLTAELPTWDSISQITWTSDNEEVATVDQNGLVTTVAEGVATITASAEGLKSATCLVNVAPIPSSFPRKYLMEHFTGDQCGYCPYGMYSMVEYSQKTSTPCIWVSHHYGYNTDEYTISESAKIASTCGAKGAPQMAMNRTKVMGTTIAFHPGYLVEDGMAETIASKCDTMAEASMKIEHTYDAATRELNVTVKGHVGDSTVTAYLLTVLIKENGLIGKQADYYWSWKTAGYKEFMHPCVVRDLLTVSQLGDTVQVKNQAYSKTFTYTVSEKWVAENCNVVAYITPLSKKPVINAEETPLVAGTTGGTEYQPFGITENKEPTNASKLTFDSLGLNKVADDKLAIELVAKSSTRSDEYGPLKLAVYLEFNTTDTILPTDTLDFVDGNEPNTFSTGTVDLVEQSFGGSHMAYYMAADMETLCHIWRIKSGKLLVYEDGGFYASGKLDNGKNFAITCTLPAPATVSARKVTFNQEHVEKLMRNGQFVISIDGIEYDIQ